MIWRDKSSGDGVPRAESTLPPSEKQPKEMQNSTSLIYDSCYIFLVTVLVLDDWWIGTSYFTSCINKSMP